MENKQKSILYITNDIFDQKTFVNALREFGTPYVLTCLSDTTEALDYLRKNVKPSLIVCDTKISGMNGFEFLKDLYREDVYKGKRIPFVFLDGTSSEEPPKKDLNGGQSKSIVEQINLGFKEQIKQILNCCKLSTLTYRFA